MKKIYRSLCLICASFFVGASNISNIQMIATVHWTGDDVLKLARKFESFLNELDKK